MQHHDPHPTGHTPPPPPRVRVPQAAQRPGSVLKWPALREPQRPAAAGARLRRAICVARAAPRHKVRRSVAGRDARLAGPSPCSSLGSAAYGRIVIWPMCGGRAPCVRSARGFELNPAVAAESFSAHPQGATVAGAWPATWPLPLSRAARAHGGVDVPVPLTARQVLGRGVPRIGRQPEGAV